MLLFKRILDKLSMTPKDPLDAIMNFSTFQDSLREGYCAIYEFCSGLFLARFAFLFLKIFIIVV